MPIFDPDGTCPLLKKKCIKHQCVWYNMLQGTNPNTGTDVHEWGCSIAWLPLLLVENSRHIMGTQAATESFRNEMVKSQNVLTSLLQEHETPKNLMKNVGSIFEAIETHQGALRYGKKEDEVDTINKLSNNKLRVKKKEKKKNVPNNK